MEQKTAEQKAAERYPAPPYVPLPGGLDEVFPPDVRHVMQTGYTTCYREEVEPRDRLLQELVDVIALVARRRGPFHVDIEAHRALAKAKEQFGIEPSKP